MTRVGRAVEKGETQGFMKILIDAETKKILGASLLGIECDEVIHSISGYHVRESTLYSDPARYAYSPYGLRVNTDDARRPQAIGGEEWRTRT